MVAQTSPLGVLNSMIKAGGASASTFLVTLFPPDQLMSAYIIDRIINMAKLNAVARKIYAIAPIYAI
jgi:hypothetical protein